MEVIEIEQEELTLEKLYEAIQEIQSLEPYNTNRFDYKYFVVDLEDRGWFFMHYGDTLKAEKGVDGSRFFPI